MIKKKIIALMGLLILSPFSFAALHLELTQGLDSAVPIALVKFGAVDDDAQDVANNLNAVMRQDFINTGRFRPIDTDSLRQPNSAATVDMKYWQD